MPKWLLLLLVVDAVFFAAVVYFVLRRRLNVSVNLSVHRKVVGAGATAWFMKEEHPRIGDYLRASWNGEPAQLPQVLETLLSELERDAQFAGQTLDRGSLRILLSHSLRTHGIASLKDVSEALAHAA